MDNKKLLQNEAKKELFEAPEAEIVMLGAEDVVAASGGFEGEYEDLGGL